MFPQGAVEVMTKNGHIINKYFCDDNSISTGKHSRRMRLGYGLT